MIRGTFHRLPLALGAAALVVLSLLPGATASGGAAGAVYALTNSSGGNAVLVYQHGGDGLVTPAGSFATGGTGTGARPGFEGPGIACGEPQVAFPRTPGRKPV